MNDMNVGEIKEICFHKDNVVIPSGYLECDGRQITEEEFPELFFHLSFNDEDVFLPYLEDSIMDELVFKKVIAYKDKTANAVNYDGEFTVKNLPNKILNRRDVCTMRQLRKS